jgi:hypothetical protein
MLNRTSKLLGASLLLATVLLTSGCGENTVPSKNLTLEDTIEVMDTQLAGFADLFTEKQIAGTVSAGEEYGKNGAKLGCDGGTSQTDGIALFNTDSITVDEMVATLTANFKEEGWGMSSLEQGDITKTIASKDNYEYWLQPFTDVVSTHVADANSGVQIYGFGPCILIK